MKSDMNSDVAKVIQPGWWLMLAYLLAGYGIYSVFNTTIVILQLFGYPWYFLVDAGLKFACLVGSVFLFGVRRGHLSPDEIGLFPPRWRLRWVPEILGLAFVVILFNLMSSAVLLWLQHGQMNALFSGKFSGMLTPAQWGEFLIMWLSISLIIPFAEELFFRGAIFTWFEQRYGIWAAILGSMFLFAVTRADLFAPGTTILVIQTLFLGLVTAILMWRWRSLWLTFSVHAISSTLMLLLAVFF